MKQLALGVVLSMLAGTAAAFGDATLLFLPSVGKGPGACVEDICAEWSTSVWISNPGLEAATIAVAFLERSSDNSDPVSATVTVPGDSTVELPDVMADPLGLDEVFGALRFTSNVPVIITGRIADTNVVTNKGTGTAGQFFPALGLTDSIGSWQATTVMGLAQEATGEHRSNFGLLEVTGHPFDVQVDLVPDGGGPPVASQTYSLRPYEAVQYNIAALGGPPGGNQLLRVIGVGGEGRAIAFGSYLDNNTGDPSSVQAAIGGADPYWLVGTWVGRAMNVTDPRPETMHTVNVVVDFEPETQTTTVTYQQDGTVLGVPDPGPATFVGRISGEGFSFTGTSEIYGTVDFTVNPWGRITGTLTDIPHEDYSDVQFTGSLTADVISLRLEVNLGTHTQDTYVVVEHQW